MTSPRIVVQVHKESGSIGADNDPYRLLVKDLGGNPLINLGETDTTGS